MNNGFQSAFNQQAANGTPVYVPGGKYAVSDVISTSSAAPFMMYGDGIGKTVIVKTVDSDLFAVTNSVSAFNHITIRDMTIQPKVPMSRGIAFNLSAGSILPSVTLENISILCGPSVNFAVGINLNNCAEVSCIRVLIFGRDDTHMTAINVTGIKAPPWGATVHKFINCSVYNVSVGAAFATTQHPDVEGIQFLNCDFVNVATGVRYTNSVSPVGSYLPSQLTWVGGHINATQRAFDVTLLTNLIIQGANLMNSGAHQHINLVYCSDFLIEGNLFTQGSGSADGITVSAPGKVTGGIIAKNVFRMQSTGTAVNVAAQNITQLTIEGNQRVGGNTTVKTTGALDNSVIIANNTPRDAIDISDDTLAGGATMSLAGIRSDYCVIKPPLGQTTCITLISRRDWDRVILCCSSSNLTLQHSTTLDGFFLQGGADYTFPAAGGRITLEKRNGGYWTEVNRV